MGILSGPLEFIKELPLPKLFTVAELGDQYVTDDAESEKKYAAKLFYKRLACGKYHCLDANGRGTIDVDLNLPLPKAIASKLGQFDLVTDFGTGEHIFNQHQCWKTMHDLCKRHAYMVFDRPTVGYEGHCFYLIQWNMISALAHANDYEVGWLEEHKTTRGILVRGALRKLYDRPFVIPQQGRYIKDLILDPAARARGPDHKSRDLRAAGVIMPREMRR